MLVQPKLVAANTLSSLGIADDEDVGNIKKDKRKEAAVRVRMHCPSLKWANLAFER